MKSLHRRPAWREGMTSVVRKGRDLRHVGLSILRLRTGSQLARTTTADEVALVILTGTCDIEAPGHRWEGLGGRRKVFDGPATAVYIPSYSHWQVTAVTDVEVAVCSSPALRSTEPFIVRPVEVIINHRGKETFQREVHDIIVANGDGKVTRLVLGETFNGPGFWSSYPPHKHDEHRPPDEVNMEEIYLFKVDPCQGFGVQVIYDHKRRIELAYRIQDGDVTILPSGYHPVAAAPGYRIYYFWVMAGDGRTLVPSDDPDHAWVK